MKLLHNYTNKTLSFDCIRLDEDEPKIEKTTSATMNLTLSLPLSPKRNVISNSTKFLSTPMANSTNTMNGNNIEKDTFIKSPGLFPSNPIGNHHIQMHNQLLPPCIPIMTTAHHHDPDGLCIPPPPPPTAPPLSPPSIQSLKNKIKDMLINNENNINNNNHSKSNNNSNNTGSKNSENNNGNSEQNSKTKEDDNAYTTQIKSYCEMFEKAFYSMKYPLRVLFNDSFSFEMLQYILSNMHQQLHDEFLRPVIMKQLIHLASTINQEEVSYHTNQIALHLCFSIYKTPSCIQCHYNTDEPEVELDDSIGMLGDGKRKEMKDVVEIAESEEDECPCKFELNTIDSEPLPASSSSSPLEHLLPSHEYVNGHTCFYIWDGLFQSKDTNSLFPTTSAALQYAKLLYHFIVVLRRGYCFFYYLSLHPECALFLVRNIGYDEVHYILLKLIYLDHTNEGILALFRSHLLEHLIEIVTTSDIPRTIYEKDYIENAALLIREVLHVPYMSTRGEPIFAYKIPFELTVDGSLRECQNLSGENSSVITSKMRKFTSRKVRYIVKLLQINRLFVKQLFSRTLRELEYWTASLNDDLKSFGKPRASGMIVLQQFLQLVETVEFSERVGRGQFGINCLNFLCPTHCMLSAKLSVKQPFGNETYTAIIDLNCILGLRIRKVPHMNLSPTSKNNDSLSPLPSPSGSQHSVDGSYLNQAGPISSSSISSLESLASVETPLPNAVRASAPPRLKSHALEQFISLEEIQSVVLDNHIPYGLAIKTTKNTTEYISCCSSEQQMLWMHQIEKAISGDLCEIEIFCSKNWEKTIADYKILRQIMKSNLLECVPYIAVFLLKLRERITKGNTLYLIEICEGLYAVAKMESVDLDTAIAPILPIVFSYFELLPECTMFHNIVTQIILFYLDDPNNKRSRTCAVIHQLIEVKHEEENGKLSFYDLLQLRHRESQNDKESQINSYFPHLQLLSNVLKKCVMNPQTKSQVHVGQLIDEDRKWRKQLFECLTPAQSSRKTSDHQDVKNGFAGVPTEPDFEIDLLQLLNATSNFTNDSDISLLEEQDCVFGNLYKRRTSNLKWHKVIVVFERSSYKLWYFYPNENSPGQRISWKWIIPDTVTSRFCIGEDEKGNSIGHYGLYVTAATGKLSTKSNAVDTHANGKELHFSVASYSTREYWYQLLLEASMIIKKLTEEYSASKMGTPLLGEARKRLGSVGNLKKSRHTSISGPNGPNNGCRESAKACYLCESPFTLYRWKHQCSRCREYFCQKCSNLKKSIPEVGLYKKVRHCQECYDKAGGEYEPIKGLQSSLKKTAKSTTDLKSLVEASCKLTPNTSLNRKRIGKASHSYDDLYSLSPKLTFRKR